MPGPAVLYVVISATAFTIVKYAGAAYLIYLGLRTLLEGGALPWSSEPPARSGRRLYWEGVVVGALNPKLALFLLAFLPQFIDPDAGPVWLQTLVLGGLFSLIATDRRLTLRPRGRKCGRPMAQRRPLRGLGSAPERGHTCRPRRVRRGLGEPARPAGLTGRASG